MAWRRGSAIVLALLCGCATPPPPAAVIGELHSGRLALSVPAKGSEPARALSATFELTGSAAQGRLSLSTPIGTSIAAVQWDPGGAWLKTSDRNEHYSDLDALSREVLGESVPIPALFDWLRGRPWPGAPSTANAASATPGFRQLGWDVDLSQFDAGRVSARQIDPPQAVVRMILDRP